MKWLKPLVVVYPLLLSLVLLSFPVGGVVTNHLQEAAQVSRVVLMVEVGPRLPLSLSHEPLRVASDVLLSSQIRCSVDKSGIVHLMQSRWAASSGE